MTCGRTTLPSRALVFLQRHRVLLVLVAADIAAKVAAFGLLPHGRPVEVLPGFRLYLAVNEWGVMGGVDGIGAVTANPAYTVLLALGLLVFAYAVYRLGASSLGFGWKLLSGLAVFFAVAFAAQNIALPLAHLTMPPNLIIGMIRVAVLVVSLAFYAASNAPVPRIAFTLLAAGALANAASYAYPPFEVVDFVMVPLQPFAELFSRGGDVSDPGAFGVINLADMYLFVFPLLLLAWPPSALFRLARGAARA